MAKKQKSGLYRSKVKVGTGADGKDIVKYISGKTKKELEQARKEVEDYYINGVGVEADRVFGEYAAEWYRVYKEPNIAPSTCAAYRTMLNKHVLPAFGERNLRAINSAELQQWLNGFKGYSQAQINQAFAVVDGVFARAKKDRIITTNPADGLFKPNSKPAEEKRALTDQERSIFKRVAHEHADGMYLAVLYYTGMRPGEVRGLKWGDFDWRAGQIHVQRDIDYAAKGAVGELKTFSADRYVPITSELRQITELHRGLPEAFLFVGSRSGGPLSQVTALRMWIRLMHACGFVEAIEESNYPKDDIRGRYKPLFTPYITRHNFITMCWEAGLDVMLTMKIVGHADYQTTMNIYTHLSKKHLDKAQVKMDEMFADKKVAQKLHEKSSEFISGK